MRALLIAAGLALFVTLSLQNWGVATFGLWGWWLASALIGGVCGLLCALVAIWVSERRR